MQCEQKVKVGSVRSLSLDKFHPVAGEYRYFQLFRLPLFLSTEARISCHSQFTCVLIFIVSLEIF